MKILCLVIITIGVGLIFDRLGDISRKLDRPVPGAGQYVTSMPGAAR